MERRRVGGQSLVNNYIIIPDAGFLRGGPGGAVCPAAGLSEVAAVSSAGPARRSRSVLPRKRRRDCRSYPARSQISRFVRITTVWPARNCRRTTINELLALLREKLDAEYYIFDERAGFRSLMRRASAGLNLAQAMVLMAAFDAAVSIDSWHKYIMGMYGKPQTVMAVDFRKNESYTYEATPAAVYQEFFRWRMKPEEIVGFENGIYGVQMDDSGRGASGSACRPPLGAVSRKRPFCEFYEVTGRSHSHEW